MQLCHSSILSNHLPQSCLKRNVAQPHGWARPRPEQRLCRCNSSSLSSREPETTESSSRSSFEHAQLGDVYNRVNVITSGYLDRLSSSQASPVLDYLSSQVGLGNRELELVLLRYPETFKRRTSDVQQVVDFLQTDLGFTGDDLRHTITRFPAVLGLHIKAHLRPHVIYLQSLGVTREQILQRPLLLGEGIETVCRFLRLCRVPRKEMSRLLASYPIDYCLRFDYTSLERDGKKEVDEDF